MKWIKKMKRKKFKDYKVNKGFSLYVTEKEFPLCQRQTQVTKVVREIFAIMEEWGTNNTVKKYTACISITWNLEAKWSQIIFKFDINANVSRFCMDAKLQCREWKWNRERCFFQIRTDLIASTCHVHYSESMDHYYSQQLS